MKREPEEHMNTVDEQISIMADNINTRQRNDIWLKNSLINAVRGAVSAADEDAAETAMPIEVARSEAWAHTLLTLVNLVDDNNLRKFVTSMAFAALMDSRVEDGILDLLGQVDGMVANEMPASSLRAIRVYNGVIRNTEKYKTENDI